MLRPYAAIFRNAKILCLEPIVEEILATKTWTTHVYFAQMHSITFSPNIAHCQWFQSKRLPMYLMNDKIHLFWGNKSKPSIKNKHTCRNAEQSIRMSISKTIAELRQCQNHHCPFDWMHYIHPSIFANSVGLNVSVMLAAKNIDFDELNLKIQSEIDGELMT